MRLSVDLEGRYIGYKSTTLNWTISRKNINEKLGHNNYQDYIVKGKHSTRQSLNFYVTLVSYQ